jgi:signal transduction histidine kinase
MNIDEPQSRNNFKVLIVGDKPENMQVLGKILCKNGLNIISATSGPQALEIMAADLPDLVLLDIAVPEMDGYEVCRKIKENPATKSIPVIFLTAQVQTEDIIHGFEAGAADYVIKPFNLSELLSRVFTHLELKRARDIITGQNDRLKYLNDTKDKFFSIISHDLRSPFTILHGFAEHLQTNYKNMNDESRQELIRAMTASAAQTLKLIENLLQWAKVQLDKMKCDPREISLSEIFDDNARLLKANAAKKNIVIKTKVYDEDTAYADYDMINLVVRNLISNALKFTGNGGEVLVEAQNKNDKEGAIEVRVSDNGIGIKAGNLEKLFRIDSHFTTDGTDNEPGTGLGLILCREFVEKNGGKIRAESESGKGSKFIFTLPKHAGEAGASPGIHSQ